MSTQNTNETEFSGFFRCHFSGCSRVFKRRDRLDTHLRIHTGERPFVCAVEGCGKSYTRSQHLSRHVENSHTERPDDSFKFSCPVCQNELANTYCLQRHIRTVHEEKPGPKPYECPEEGCTQSFHKKKQLVTHRLEEHSDHILEAKKCHKCPHEGCDKTFTWMNLLKKHMKVHQGYPCSVQNCDKVFPNWSSLRKHVAFDHAKEHRCHECGINFSRKPNLTQHIKRKHLEPKKMFTCPVSDCGRNYSYKSNLALHVRESHEGEHIWKNRRRLKPTKKSCKKISLAAKLCGLDDRGERLKLLKARSKRAAKTVATPATCESEEGKHHSSMDKQLLFNSHTVAAQDTASEHELMRTELNPASPVLTINNNNYKGQSEMDLERAICDKVSLKQDIPIGQELTEITVIIVDGDRAEQTVVAVKAGVQEAR